MPDFDSDDEVLDALDENGRALGQKTRAQIHADNDWHALVFVWSAWESDGSRRMLLQRRASHGFTGRIDALAGGHICAGETIIDGARRELLEEVGLPAGADDFLELGSSRMERTFGDCRRVHQHQLLYPIPLDIERMQFSDEVDGFVDVDVDAFADLARGTCASIPGRARYADSGGDLQDIDLAAASVTGYPDEILDTFHRCLRAIGQWLTDGQIDTTRYNDPL